MVAYHFPPITSGGVRRSVKFARYLPEFGWHPVVLTVDEQAPFYDKDAATLQQIPSGCKVVRTLNPEGKVMHWLKRLHLTRLLKILFVPDISLLWVPSAVRAGLRLVREDGIDVIYTSSMPISIHLIGLVLHKVTGKPWVADWRDIWIQHTSTLALAPSFLHRGLYRWLERTFVHSATMTIGHSDGHAEVVRRDYPEVGAKRIVSIPMGYDPDDFVGPAPQPFTKFTVLFAGTFYGAPVDNPPPQGFPQRLLYSIHKATVSRRSLEVRSMREVASPLFFLQAVKALLDEHPDLADDFQVVFLGKLTPANRALLTELGLESQVQFLGWMPYEEALLNMRKANALLLVVLPSQEGWSGFLPGKTMEYLATGRPILAMAVDGDVRNLIQETQAGIVVNPRDVAGAKVALHSLYLEWKQGRVYGETNPNKIRLYEWQRLTHHLANVFSQAVQQV